MRALLLALLLLAPAAEAATPRPHAVVDGEQLRLADLFDGAGPRGTVPIGPAPAPGGRLIVEAAQLAAIARQHGLAWRPLGAERVVIERPGRAVAREEIAELLRAEFAREGMDPDAELEMPGFSAPLVPLGAAPRMHLEQSSYDPSTQRFAATLVLTPEAAPTQRLRVTGRAIATVPVVIATRRLAAGEVVGTADLRVVRWRAERVRPGAATEAAQVEGQQLRRAIGAELPFAVADLAAPTLVNRNQAVTIIVEAPGLTMTAQGRALESAARGGVVPVMNLASRAVVEAVAIGPGRVRVMMGSAPVSRIPEGQTPTAAIAARAAQR
jgi:flagellar basal body P-ring formation protein FlgA